MVGMKIQEWLDSLRRGRSWEEVGARKLPYVTIVLKYVFSLRLPIQRDLFLFLCFDSGLRREKLRAAGSGGNTRQGNGLIPVSQLWL